ncbi:hypothetical protein HK405_005451 [Cladochytrium tenue]|nr:hypothetical protein HK405_005451 [Cladochytrium tenue]
MQRLISTLSTKFHSFYKTTEEEQLDETIRKNYENIEHEFEERSKQTEEEGDAGNSETFSRIQENQFAMIEALNILYDKLGEAPIAAAGHLEAIARRNVQDAVSPLLNRISDLNSKIDSLSVKLQQVAGDLQTVLSTVHTINRKGDDSMRVVVERLDSSRAKLEETHQVATAAAAAGNAGGRHAAWYALYFVLGAVLAYAASVAYRALRESPPKKMSLSGRSGSSGPTTTSAPAPAAQATVIQVTGTGNVICEEAEVRGPVSMGDKNVVHPKCRIVSEGGGPIQIGSFNIIEENVQIINWGARPLIIGDNNLFEVGCSMVASGTSLGDNCVVGARCVTRRDEEMLDDVVIYGHSHERRTQSKPSKAQLTLHYRHLDYLHDVSRGARGRGE